MINVSHHLTSALCFAANFVFQFTLGHYRHAPVRNPLMNLGITSSRANVSTQRQPLIMPSVMLSTSSFLKSEYMLVLSLRVQPFIANRSI
jgi:hypothetical protein